MQNALIDQFYGLTWNESADTYARTGLVSHFKAAAKPYDELMSIHKLMRRCVISDAGVVQYYLDPDSSANKEGVAPSVTGTLTDATAFNKLKCVGAFTAANCGVGRIIHNTTVGKTAFYAVITARDSDDEVTIENYMHGGKTPRCFGVATTDTTNKLVASATNFTTAGVAVGDIVRRVSTDRLTVNAIMKVKAKDDDNTLSLKDWAGSDYDGFPSGNEKFVISPESFSTGDTFEICTAVLDGTDGQVMVEIPKFYYKYSYAGTTHSWSISLYPLSGFVIHPAFIRNGVVVPRRFFAAFNGYKDGSNKLRSVLGQFPITNITRATARTYANNVSTSWSQVDFYLYSAVQLLYLIEYASFYSQSVIGNGATTWGGTNWNNYNGYYPVWKSGLSLFKGNKTFNNSPVDNVLGNGGWMTYRGIENFFGHIWKFIDGININNNRAYICNNSLLPFADDTLTGYTDVGVNMVNSDGYQSTLLQLGYCFFPASVGASSSTKITDYYYQNSGWRLALSGGSLSSGADAVFFCLSLAYTSSYTYTYIGYWVAL